MTSSSALAPAKNVYRQLNDQHNGASIDTLAWLHARMEQCKNVQISLPENPDELYQWMESNVVDVGSRYTAYLQRRASGGQRELLTNRSHALNFLRGIAPTKMVDGAWLYSSLYRWQDERMMPLIHTYLEELGDGDPAQNHVVMFKKLLKQAGALDEADLSDEHYIQGAIQLALAEHGRGLVPEMIGFNLGYEQLPLHLHISAYELNELGIDPYYFTVHITVDNAGSGHARQAIDAVIATLPTETHARARFYDRVRTGFALNELGLGATEVASRFNLDAAITDMLKIKSKYGRAAHANYCKVAGRTVNDWLADEAQVPEFLNQLQSTGWIVRNEDPTRSRFWQLVQGDRADMFGVFSALELQLIYDWIAGSCATYLPGPDLPSVSPRTVVRGRHVNYRVQQRLKSHRLESDMTGEKDIAMVDTFDRDYDREPADLQMSLAAASCKEQRINLLIAKMSPHAHHLPEGLFATRLFRSAMVSS